MAETATTVNTEWKPFEPQNMDWEFAFFDLRSRPGPMALMSFGGITHLGGIRGILPESDGARGFVPLALADPA